MRLVAFDLDDTLMRCGFDYDRAINAFGEYIAGQTAHTVEEAVDHLNEIDRQNVEEHGLSMERFPESFVQAYEDLADAPTKEGRQHVEELAYSVFKTAEEYAARGYMDGAEELLADLNDRGHDLHIITAGDERVQRRKLDGLNIDQYVDDTHIVPINSKADKLAELMEAHDYTPDETYMVGNSLSSDISAAIDAGAYGIHIPAHQWRPADRDDLHDHDRVTVYPDLDTLHDDVPEAFLREAEPVAG